jgi:pimeloyl-ACP methyl ester carboxylesterase
VSPAVLSTARVPTEVGEVVCTSGGTGVPVVYLHSAGGEGADLAGAFFEEIARRYALFAPMLPGFGGSEGLERIDDMEDAVYHTLDLLGRIGAGRDNPPHLVGLSLGGWLAAEIATRHPERVRSLTLVNPAGLYLPEAPIKELFGRRLDELADDTFADPDHPARRAMHELAALSLKDASALPFEVVRPFFEAMAATAKLAWNPYLHNPKLRRRLGWVTAPTLVVAGAKDGLIPNAHARAFAEGIPGARLVVFEDASHMIPCERPAELARLVLDHLDAA